MKYWDIRTGPMADAIHDARHDDFALIEEEGTVNVANNHWVELELRVINSNAISWFAHGNCAALALALHDVTGWPLLIATSNADPNLLADTWMHVVVQRPDGLYLDIQGAHSYAQVTEYWLPYATGEHADGDITLHSMPTRDDVVAITGDITLMDPFEQAVVRDFADHVLTQYPIAISA